MNFDQNHSGVVLKKVYGAMFHIWCDKADADGADDGIRVINVTAPLIEAMGVACAKVQA